MLLMLDIFSKKVKAVKNYYLSKKTKPYMSNMKGKLKNLGEWKIHLTIKVNFMSLKDDDKRLIHSKNHSKSDNIEIMIGNNTGETIELFSSLLCRDEIDLDKSMKGN